MAYNVFITGIPRSGKSTLLESILKYLDKSKTNKKGLITRENRENQERTGFEVITSTGERRILASKLHKTPIQVESSISGSPYYVDIPSFELILPVLSAFTNETLYIDEVGQMQLHSDRFQALVRTYLDSQNCFLGTLSRDYPHPLIKHIRQRDDVTIFHLDPANREVIYEKIMEIVRQ
ncbi:MAG: nucleoside-triphosphatase [Candidatus Woesearchaeota archaeon]